jgi:hypothetical protein
MSDTLSHPNSIVISFVNFRFEMWVARARRVGPSRQAAAQQQQQHGRATAQQTGNCQETQLATCRSHLRFLEIVNHLLRRTMKAKGCCGEGWKRKKIDFWKLLEQSLIPLFLE